MGWVSTRQFMSFISVCAQGLCKEAKIARAYYSASFIVSVIKGSTEADHLGKACRASLSLFVCLLYFVLFSLWQCQLPLVHKQQCFWVPGSSNGGAWPFLLSKILENALLRVEWERFEITGISMLPLTFGDPLEGNGLCFLCSLVGNRKLEFPHTLSFKF